MNMSVEMPSITEVKMSPGRLGPRLRDLARLNAFHFTEQRFLPSVVGRWFDLDDRQASDRIAHIQKAHDESDGGFQAFPVIDADGFVQGMGTLQRSPDPMLRRLRVPLPRGILQRTSDLFPVSGLQEYPDARVNLSAWVDETREFDLLHAAYATLLSRHRQRFSNVEDGDPIAWTIEPERAHHSIHWAIQAAGLIEVDTGRYDDEEASGL